MIRLEILHHGFIFLNFLLSRFILFTQYELLILFRPTFYIVIYCAFDPDLVFLRQCRQRVLSEHFRCIIQPGHVHGIATKSPHIDAMVVEHVTIEPIIMPYFLVLFILEILLKMVNQPRISAKIVDENFGAITEIVLRSCEKRCAYNFTFANRRLIFNIEVNSLSIPCNNIFNILQHLNTFQALLRSRDYRSPIALFHYFVFHVG